MLEVEPAAGSNKAPAFMHKRYSLLKNIQMSTDETLIYFKCVHGEQKDLYLKPVQT